MCTTGTSHLKFCVNIWVWLHILLVYASCYARRLLLAVAALYIYECNSFTGYTCIDSILNIRKMANEYCIMLGSTNSSMAIKL